jgi:hypothetical protein
VDAKIWQPPHLYYSHILVPLVDLIHRSQCTLHLFGIRIPNLTEPQIMEWLNMDELKQITCLVLESPITDNILRALHRPAKYGHQSCYFPNLKRLDLGKCVSTINNGLLLRMLGSRFWTLPYIAGPKLSSTAAMIKRTTVGMRELEITGINNARGGISCTTKRRLPLLESAWWLNLFQSDFVKRGHPRYCFHHQSSKQGNRRSECTLEGLE